LLVEGGGASSVAGGQRPVRRRPGRLGVMGRLVSGYSLPPPPLQPLEYCISYHGQRNLYSAIMPLGGYRTKMFRKIVCGRWYNLRCCWTFI